MPNEPNSTAYVSPLVTRNASAAMSALFGAEHRIRTWRRLWLALAEAQRKLGLAIPAQALAQMRQRLADIDFAVAARYEKKLRHDVMAHIHAFADVAPAARGILHLGATSAYVVDNADLIIMRDSLGLVRDGLGSAIDALARFALKYRNLPTLGFTHFQPAQLTTVGKRAALWCWDFVRDLEEAETRLERLPFRGVKGTTGTQASFLALFDGDHRKVERLERMVAEAFGFDLVEPVTGQTYSRKVDAQMAAALAGVAASVHKFANDIRLLAHLKEIEEPFEEGQVGSSAMAYKRNPMLSERATGLARFVLSVASSPFQTAAEQWFERTLDDSSNKRVVIPELFLAADGMVRIVAHVARGLVVYTKVIRKHVEAELPFMATEEILMAGVAAGGDRQALHEAIRVHSRAAAARVKREGRENHLISLLGADPMFAKVNVKSVLDPKRYIGRAPEQVDAFVKEYVAPIRRRLKRALNARVDLEV